MKVNLLIISIIMIVLSGCATRDGAIIFPPTIIPTPPSMVQKCKDSAEVNSTKKCMEGKISAQQASDFREMLKSSGLDENFMTALIVDKDGNILRLYNDDIYTHKDREGKEHKVRIEKIDNTKEVENVDKFPRLGPATNIQLTPYEGSKCVWVVYNYTDSQGTFYSSYCKKYI
ncbi:MAG: hypothetical protein IPI97_01330 [Nitrosomonas sp.]|nr:hypothetical protein [Nitrosomonas sp.]MBK7363697.1 hypothetical protein [Nitrosomonas sp.]